MRDLRRSRLLPSALAIAATVASTGCATTYQRTGVPAFDGAPKAARVAAVARATEVCRYDTPTRTRFPEWVCTTREEAAMAEANATELLRSWQRGAAYAR